MLYNVDYMFFAVSAAVYVGNITLMDISNYRILGLRKLTCDRLKALNYNFKDFIKAFML